MSSYVRRLPAAARPIREMGAEMRDSVFRSVPYDIGDFSTSALTVNANNGLFQKVTLINSGVSTVSIEPPSNGTEGMWLTLRIKAAVAKQITFSTILIPSDSLLTTPKTLTVDLTYIVRLYYNGAAWELVTLIGGYA
jgi:hypothetical protein